MIRKITLLFIGLLFLTGLNAQIEKITISGTVADDETGETLIGATVLVSQSGEGTVTNEYGFYSLTMPKGDTEITVQFSYIGFQKQEQSIVPNKDQTLNISLGTGVNLEEVVVKANSFEEQLNSTEMSVETISTREAKLLPALLGESDILRTIQLKPGIPSGSEGSTGLFVRGGGSDQNLIELDEAIVYNPNHLFGFFSTFNTDAVKDLKLYKGGFPAEYGGRLSSVIDVKLKEGNKKKFSGSGGLGLISSRLTLEGPIVKDKASFMVSGRRTYVDIFTNAINRGNEDNPDANLIPAYSFYDLNTKLNYTLSDKDRIYLSGYFGRDQFGFDSDLFDFSFNWGNATGTARWNHVYNPKLFANTTATFSDYKYNIRNEVTGFSFDIGSSIRDMTFKQDFYYSLNNKHTLKFGGAATYHQFEVGRLKAGSDDGEVSFEAGQDYDGTEAAIYLSDEYSPNKRLTINGGLRLSSFFNDGATYINLEPRIASVFRATEKLSLKASYARMNQYLHLVSSSGFALPTDVWYPSTQTIKPQQSDQVAAGFSLLLGKKYFLTNEYYYKKLRNQVDFVDYANLFANADLEGDFAIGKGFAYGMELGIEKKEGQLTGWIGYTLALTRLGDFQTVDPNQIFGQGTAYFSPRYDRRHDISVVALYEINKRLSASASWVYGSGDLIWLPSGRTVLQDVGGTEFQAVVPVYGDRNNVRLAPFHRLDLSFIIKFFPKWGESDLTLSAFNAYDRRNAFFVFLEPEFREVTAGGTTIQVPERVAAKQVSLFPVLPSATFNFKF